MRRRAFIVESLGLAASGAAASAVPAHWQRSAVQRLSDPFPPPPATAKSAFTSDEGGAKSFVAASLDELGKTLIYDRSYVTLS